MKKIIFISIFAFSLIFNNAFAQTNSIYLVENIEGKANSNSVLEAKDLATKNARRTAFAELLLRLNLDVNLSSKFSDDEIFDIVLSEQISNEKISPNEYFANFNILFSKSIVDKILENKNVAKSDLALQQNYLLIPVKVFAKNGFDDSLSKFSLWDEENEWKKSLQNLLKKRRISQFIVPESDLENIANLSQDNIENVSFADLENMLSKYKAQEAIVMFFTYDKIDNKVTILIQDFDKLQQKKYKLSFVNVDRLSYEDLTDKTCEKLLEYLVNSKKTAAKLEKNIVKIEIAISGLNNWLAIKNKIEKSGLISQLDIESISKDYVVISINYSNKKEAIIEAFQKINLVLEKKNNEVYLLKN